MSACLLIPAGGSGTRFGGSLPKQFVELAGIPILLHSLRAFTGLVGSCVIAAPPEHHARVLAIAADAPFPVRVVAGGASRLDSVHRALLASDGDPLLVHDAVRPLVPRHCIAACLEVLTRSPGAVVALPCAATVKQATPAGLVGRTVPRGDLWLAQTPQGFRREAGLAGFARAIAEGWTCTDDAEVLERAGYAVELVPGDPRNLKITEPGDLPLAEALLKS